MSNHKICEQLGCLANVDGRCAAEECKGAIIRLIDPHEPKPSYEMAAKRYKIIRAMFDEWLEEDVSKT